MKKKNIVHVGSDVHWRAEKEGANWQNRWRTHGGWQQICILTVSNATTFSFVLPGNNSAIFTKEMKKERILRKKALSDGHSDQPYQGGDSQVMLILKAKIKILNSSVTDMSQDMWTEEWVR